jgi:hypothetical protein
MTQLTDDEIIYLKRWIKNQKEQERIEYEMENYDPDKW